MGPYQLLDEGVFDLSSKTIIKRGQPGWSDYQTWLTQGGVLLPKDSLGQLDLVTAKANRTAEIDSYAASLRNKIIAGRSAGEMAAWTIKLFDAMAVLAAQPSAFTPILATLRTILGLPVTPTSYNHAIAMIRGITETEHATKVVSQAVPFLAAEAAIDGIRGKHNDAINAMLTVPEIITYDWSTGWPAI
jgi:hypothetical protein